MSRFSIASLLLLLISGTDLHAATGGARTYSDVVYEAFVAIFKKLPVKPIAEIAALYNTETKNSWDCTATIFTEHQNYRASRADVRLEDYDDAGIELQADFWGERYSDPYYDDWSDWTGCTEHQKEGRRQNSIWTLTAQGATCVAKAGDMPTTVHLRANRSTLIAIQRDDEKSTKSVFRGVITYCTR
jgi:hypothetical protein